jgi:hypothetical protein
MLAACDVREEKLPKAKFIMTRKAYLLRGLRILNADDRPGR